MKIFKIFKKSKDEDCDEKSRLDEIKSTCPILYKERGYWSCGKGWDDALERLSYKIEELHERYYKKYKIRAEFLDIKEKWSTLRIEYDLIYDPFFLLCWTSKILSFLGDALRRINYKMISVVDCPDYILHEEKELTKVEYVIEKKRNCNCSNVKCFERDGKYYKVADYEHYKSTHQEPSRFRLIYAFMSWCNKQNRKINCRSHEVSKKKQMIGEYMRTMIDQFIKEAENETYHSCELCGLMIGEDWSPVCETTGWIRRICLHCAEKCDDEYYMNGDLLFKGKIVKTKALIEEERQASLKKYNAKTKIENEQYENELAEAIEETKDKDIINEIKK